MKNRLVKLKIKRTYYINGEQERESLMPVSDFDIIIILIFIIIILIWLLEVFRW